jgi:hypothetical protein
MLQAGPERPEAAAIGTTSPHFWHGFSRNSVHPPSPGVIQEERAAKKFSGEGKQSAEQVMGIPEPRESQADTNAGGAAPTPPVVFAAVQGTGTQLEPSVRREFEDNLGHDFSAVRIHSGAVATRAAAAVGASAYTLGRHIVIREGLDDPSTPEGHRLLAHELTHAVQQSAFADHQLAGAPVSGSDHPSERQAQAGAGAPVSLAAPAVQRAPLDIVMSGEHVKIDLALKGWRRSLKFKGGQSQIVYILKDGKTGEILKVGKTTVGRLKRRFGEYVRAGNKWGRELAADVYPMRKRPGRKVQVFEKEIRAGLEKAGHRLPWDNTNGRLGRPGKGIPEPNDPDLELIDEVEAEHHAAETGTEKGGTEEEKVKEGTEEEKVKEEKESKGPEEEKGEGSAGAANLGFGISIFSSQVGGANVGVGISVGSTSASVGTAGAGVSWFSDSAAAGAAGAGIAKGSQTAGVAVAGAGMSEDTTAVAAGAAGAGKSSDVTAAGAGVAGAGKATDSVTAAAGAAGHGEIVGSTVAGAGTTGSGKMSAAVGAGTGPPKQTADPQDVRGPDAGTVPLGQSHEESATGTSKPEGPTTGSGGTKAGGQVGGLGSAAGISKPEGPTTESGGTKAGGQLGRAGGGTKAGTQDDAAPGARESGKASALGTGTGSADRKPQQQANLTVVPVFPDTASEKDRQMIAAEASKVADMLNQANDAQRLFLQYLANQGANGQYVVPTSEWVATLLKVTDGLSPQDIDRLKQLNWKPGHVTEKELRERVRKALASHKPPPADGAATRSAESSPSGAKQRGESAATKRQPGRPSQQGVSQETSAAHRAHSPGGGRDRVIAPPRGTEHKPSGVFAFHILSGITASSRLRQGQAVHCAIRILELDDKRRTFVLDGVSITFDGRKDATTLKVHFTDDFWSPKYNFFGLGGRDTMTEYSFPSHPSKH